MNVLIFNDKCFFFKFFGSLYKISSQNNGSIFNFYILFDGKVNLVGAFRRSLFRAPNIFKSTRNNKRKIKEKRGFLRKFDFQQNWFRLPYRYMTFSLNVYFSILYRYTIQFSKFFDFFWIVHGHIQFPKCLVFFSMNASQILFVVLNSLKMCYNKASRYNILLPWQLKNIKKICHHFFSISS